MEVFRKKTMVKNGIISAERKVFCGETIMHSHDFFELEYILEGSGEYNINGNTYRIGKNMIFFMTPADFHTVKADAAEMINVMFPCEHVYMDSLFELMMKSNKCTAVYDHDQTLVSAMLQEIVMASERGNYRYSLQFLTCLLWKLATFSNEGDSAAMPSYIRSAVLYILENFRNDISLDDVAAYVGMSPAYLSSIFNQHMGIGIKKYINNMRFDHAKNLLLFSEMTVTEICDEAGFNNYANFMRHFKVRYHMTPLEYRKNSGSFSFAGSSRT